MCAAFRVLQSSYTFLPDWAGAAYGVDVLRGQVEALILASAVGREADHRIIAEMEHLRADQPPLDH